MKNQRQTRARPVREASPVLQNRRERLEELNIETQEVRARRELAKLQREEQEEAEHREAQIQAREEEAVQRQAEIELEQERLVREEAQEQRRRERERLQEQQRLQSEQQLAAFRQRWYDAVAEAVMNSKYSWPTPSQRKEVTEALEAEIERRQPADEPRMRAIVDRTLEALLEPLRTERDAQERRQKLATEALWRLPYSATEADKVKAGEAIAEALGRLDNCADVCKMRVAAQEAVWPFRQAIEKRDLDTRLISWALRSLPWSRTDGDIARIRRECEEILAELPPDVREPEGREALEPTVAEACAEITKRQAGRDRQARKAQLIGEGLAEVNTYMLELLREDEITRDEYLDSDFTGQLRTAVRRGLESELADDENTKEARELAREIMDGQLE